MAIKRIIRYLFLHVGNLFRGMKVCFLRQAGITIGNNCFISRNAKFDLTRGSIIIGNNCTITYGCCLIAHDPMERRIHPGASGTGSIILEDHVYMGINTIVLKSVKIGHHAIIGAGSVVTKDIPPYAVVLGNPQKVVRYWGEAADLPTEK